MRQKGIIKIVLDERTVHTWENSHGWMPPNAVVCSSVN